MALICTAGFLAVTRRRPTFALQFGLPGFDRLQESIGDQAAENLEAEVALAIVGSLREMDYVGRWTDAEYTILLPRCTEPAAKIVAQRLIASVKSALGSTTHANDLEPIVGIAPVAQSATAEQVIEWARRQLAEPTVPA